MSMSLLFGVPLLVEDIDPALRDAIHAKVAAYLESEQAKADITPSPEESVATSYYKPEASILADAGLDELEQLVIGAARTFLEKGLRLPPRRLEIERAWINVFEPGAQEAQHTHDGSLLSCSYYVEAPKDCGCLVLPDPIASRRTHREFTRTAGRDLLTRSEIAVEPQPGRLIMFESWMPHYVQCNKSAEVRISIAMNLREVSPRVPIPQISSPPASSQTPSSQTPSSQPASSQPASSQPASSQPARGDDVHASEPEPQRTNAARAAAAPFA